MAEPIDETPTQPLDYAAINATWAALLAGVLVSTRSDAPRAGELPVLGMAAFALSKALAKEKVGSWARVPVVDEAEGKPKGSRLRYAVGELVTCTRCVGTWAAAALASTQIVAPRFGRLLTWSLGAAAANDFLQAGFVALTSKSNELKDRAET